MKLFHGQIFWEASLSTQREYKPRKNVAACATTNCSYMTLDLLRGLGLRYVVGAEC